MLLLPPLAATPLAVTVQDIEPASKSSWVSARVWMPQVMLLGPPAVGSRVVGAEQPDTVTPLTAKLPMSTRTLLPATLAVIVPAQEMVLSAGDKRCSKAQEQNKRRCQRCGHIASTLVNANAQITACIPPLQKHSRTIHHSHLQSWWAEVLQRHTLHHHSAPHQRPVDLAQ